MKSMDKEKVSSLFEKLPVPLLRPSRFAEFVGMAPATVTTLMDRGELPVVRLSPNIPGKRPARYINLVALFELCQTEGEEWLSGFSISTDSFKH